MFEVPKGWCWCYIDDLCDVVRGGSPRPAGSKEFYDGDIPFLKVADLTRDNFMYVTYAQNSIKEAGLVKTRQIEVNTLLLTNSGATLGVPKINTFPATINDGIAAFLYLPQELQYYMYWFLKANTGRFRGFNQGAAQPNLNTDIIKNVRVPLPPVNEQKRIVNEIDRWYAELEVMESNEGDLLKAIDQAKSKILDLAIHGKLIPQDPNDEPAIELLKRINPKFEPCDVEQLWELPNSWCWTTLGNISNYGKCIHVETKDIPNNSWVLELEDLEKDTAKLLQRVTCAERDIKGVRSAFRKGEVLFSKLRTYLNKVLVAPEDGYCSTEIVPITLYDSFSSEYINHVLRSKYFVDYTTSCGYGVKMPRLSTTDACKGLIPVPPYQEQLRIVAKIEELFAVLESIKESLE